MESLVRPNGLGRYSFVGDNEIRFNPPGRQYDTVVMMDCSQCPIHPQLQQAFHDTVKKDAQILRAHGVRPVLFMSWAYKDKPEMTRQLADQYTRAGKENGAMVIPAGLAFAKAIERRPSLELYQPDKRHPTLEGTYLATLQTGLPDTTAGSCAASARKPYIVVSSVPVELPHSGGQGTIDPHVVFRVIQGYRYFGSYGITNLVGGADSKACQLQNVVQGLAGKGNYSFSDVRSLKAFAPDEKVAPAKAFDTLDQAAGYVNKGSEFANVQRMLMSLEIKS